jgi:preprotein translocase SecE subunit
MSRDRQRAKQRQADRRARRLAQQGGAGSGATASAREREEVPPVEDPRVSQPAPGIDPELAVGAPPQEEGRSDQVIADDPDLEVEADLVEEDFDDEVFDDEELDPAERGAARPTPAPVGRRGRDEPEGKSRPRVVQFLIAVWAELQRVQWPDRQALTTLTGVVLGFVLIAGGYLGLLDAIFSRLIQAIL